MYVNHCKGAERIRVVCLQVLILRVYTDLNIVYSLLKVDFKKFLTIT